MTEEQIFEQEHKKCFCHNKWFKKFIVTFLSVYLGVLCALCTFCAIHKPKMPPFAHHKIMYKYNDKDFDFEQFEKMRKEMEKFHQDIKKEMEKFD